MKNLVFGALLFAGLSQATGCIITSDDDPEGRFFLTWTLTSGANEISCANAGADGVSVLATPVGTQVGIEDIFSCEAGQGTTAPLPPDTYTVVVTILEEGTDAALGTSQPRTEDIFDGEITDLGEFNFSFGAPGDIDFSVDYAPMGGSNCGGGTGGNAVDDQETSVFLQGGNQCIAVALLLDGTQDVADICSEIPPCVENNVLQTLPDLDPGDYELIIEGLVDVDATTSVACYRGLVDFTVDGDDDLGILIIPFDDAKDTNNTCVEV